MVCMANTDITAVIIVVGYAIISNLILFEFAKLGIGINCPELENQLSNVTDTFNYTAEDYPNLRKGSPIVTIYQIAVGRCSGIEWWLYAISQVPVIIGILFIARKFIGFT